MSADRRILVIDQDPAFRRQAQQALAALGFTVTEAPTGRAGLAELGQWTPECVIVALELPDLRGIDVLRTISTGFEPRPPAFLVANECSMVTAVEAMKLGAKDVIMKPLAADDLREAVSGAIARGELVRDMSVLEVALEGLREGFALETDTPAMKAAIERVERLATVEMPLVLVGERGTGKGALARHCHASGPRAGKPFVVVPRNDRPIVVEQALFGSSGRPSAFAQAGEGTVFIESIVSLGPSGQERLARALAELSSARASGEAVSCPRVVVACERELQQEVQNGRLREDLARRLAPLCVHVPALRERKRDVPALVTRVLARLSREQGRQEPIVSEVLMQHFVERDWPANLRELESVLIRTMALSKERDVSLEDVVLVRMAHADSHKPEANGAKGWTPTAVDPNGGVLRYDDYEAEIFRFALDRAGGCVSRAAEMLGVGRATMYRKMRSYDIDAPPVSERAILRTGRRAKEEDAQEMDGPFRNHAA